MVPPPLITPTPLVDQCPEEPSKVTKAKLKKQATWLRNATVVGFAAVFGGSGGLAWKVLDKFDVVNAAQAQIRTDTSANTARLDRQEQRIEAVDAGTRQAIERLERKMDASDERAQKERDQQRLMLQAVLNEVRKR